ncbi:hypothetical protein HTG_13705 [Natrinema mahii]|nr:hypothetical protein HTG_13705 [Natrinema mahii]
MDLTASLVAARAREYREREPLYAVEAEQLETLPAAFAAGEYGRRDAVWVVRWYYRRFLGDYPDADRRAAEDRFRDNDFDAVRDAIADAVAARDAVAAVDALTHLEAVDVPVAAAFCMFLDPDEYVAVGPREWATLREAGELERPYPDPPSVADYERYRERCRTLAERFDCDLWTLYRALWRLAD